MADKLTTAGDTVSIGPFEIASDTLTLLPVEDANKNGMVLANERRKVLVKHGDKFVVYTLSAYIQREPLDDGEADKVKAAAADRDQKSKAKKEEAQAERERAIKASFEMGQSSTISALKNLDALAQGARHLSNLNR